MTTGYHNVTKLVKQNTCLYTWTWSNEPDIECGGERIARYGIDERQYQDVPRPRSRDNLDSENWDNSNTE